MTKLNWDKAKRKNFSQDKFHFDSFYVGEEFFCIDRGQVVSLTLKHIHVHINGLLKLIISERFSKKPTKEQQELVFQFRKLHEKLNDDLNYYGSTTYRKVIKVLEAYQHWKPTPPTQFELDEIKRKRLVTLEQLRNCLLTLNTPQFLNNNVQYQKSFLRNLKNLHYSLIRTWYSSGYRETPIYYGASNALKNYSDLAFDLDTENE